MKVTLELLKKHKACEDAIKEFINLKLEGIEVYDLIKMLHERKDDNEYSYWLFKKLKLSGLSVGYRRDGSVWYKHNYKNGELHGLYVDYRYDGSVVYKDNYKDGKLHGLCISYWRDGSVRYKHNYKNGEEI